MFEDRMVAAASEGLEGVGRVWIGPPKMFNQRIVLLLLDAQHAFIWLIRASTALTNLDLNLRNPTAPSDF